MIRRLRSPDGPIRDIDYGPGPVGHMARLGAPRIGVQQFQDPTPSGWNEIYQSVAGKRTKLRVKGR